MSALDDGRGGRFERPSPCEYMDPPPDPRDDPDGHCRKCGYSPVATWSDAPDTDRADHWECPECGAGCCPSDCRGPAAELDRVMPLPPEPKRDLAAELKGLRGLQAAAHRKQVRAAARMGYGGYAGMAARGRFDSAVREWKKLQARIEELESRCPECGEPFPPCRECLRMGPPSCGSSDHFRRFGPERYECSTCGDGPAPEEASGDVS